MTPSQQWLARPAVAALACQLRVRIPLVQAPMVGVSTPQLAAAVSDAGALGSVGLGASDVSAARALIRATRALTTQPFNANFFCHAPPTPAPTDKADESAWLAHLAPLFDEFGAKAPDALARAYGSFLDADTTDAMTAMLLEEKPAVVSFHFGLPPSETVAALRDAGIITLACVTSPEEGQLALATGVDVLVAQGHEAGGHRGVFDPERDQTFGTLALVELLARDARVPVIAAGGIMNGAGIAAALALGAAGVQLGTAFILCPESSADEAFRQALQSERAYNTNVSAAISGRPARGLVNRLFREVGTGGVMASMPTYPLPYAAAKALDRAARATGSTDFAVQLAGQGAPLARAMPAGELVRTLADEVPSS